MIRRREVCKCDCEECPVGCSFMSEPMTDDERRKRLWSLALVGGVYAWLCPACTWNRIVREAAAETLNVQQRAS